MATVVYFNHYNYQFLLLDDIDNSVWPYANRVLAFPIARKSLAGKRVGHNFLKRCSNPSSVWLRNLFKIFSCSWFYL